VATPRARDATAHTSRSTSSGRRPPSVRRRACTADATPIGRLPRWLRRAGHSAQSCRVQTGGEVTAVSSPACRFAGRDPWAAPHAADRPGLADLVKFISTRGALNGHLCATSSTTTRGTRPRNRAQGPGGGSSGASDRLLRRVGTAQRKPSSTTSPAGYPRGWGRTRRRLDYHSPMYLPAGVADRPAGYAGSPGPPSNW